MSVERNFEARSCKPHFRGKAMSITYSKCVCIALIVQHAQRLRRAMLSVVCPALQHFSTLFHKRYDFLGKVIEH